MDKYYQLLDRDPSTISPIWKACHILCLIIIIISGFLASYAFGKAEIYFGSNCILFATMSFLNESASTYVAPSSQLPDTIIIPFNMWHTQWGPVSLCNFCQFTPLCSSIFGIVWCVFFIMCSRGGAGYTTDEIYRPWRLVYPAMIYTLISTTIMFASLVELSAGIKHFCAQFEPVFHTTRCTSDINKYTLSFSTTQQLLIAALKTALVCSYVCFFTGLAHLCLLLLRIKFVVDFKVIFLNVMKMSESVNTSPRTSVENGLPEKLLIVPLKEDTVPIAKRESFSDGLSTSPRINQPKLVHFCTGEKIIVD